MSSRGVDKLIEVRQRERVLWTRLVEVREINADSPFSVLFSDYDNVGQPFWILDLTNEPHAEQTFDFLVDDCIAFESKLPPLLSDGLM